MLQCICGAHEKHGEATSADNESEMFCYDPDQKKVRTLCKTEHNVLHYVHHFGQSGYTVQRQSFRMRSSQTGY